MFTVPVLLNCFVDPCLEVYYKLVSELVTNLSETEVSGLFSSL